MQLLHLLFFTGAAFALAFPGTTDPGCCCCNPSKGAIVCNPDIPSTDCFCPLVKCPDDAPTITEAPSKPTTPPSYPDPEEKREDRVPLPPPGTYWCCCCNGKDNVCVAKPKGESCICLAVVCPEGAKTIYPPTRPDRPGRPEARDRPERPGRPGRPERPVRPTV